MVEVKVLTVYYDEANKSPVVLLKEISGNRVLPIFIGYAEAAAISYALEKVEFVRPLTLDLMKRIIESLNYNVKRVVITKIKDNTFYAEVILESDGNYVAIDARPSDSIGLALRTNSPIYVNEEVMDACATIISESEEERLERIRESIRRQKPEDLGEFQI
ncbi:MAG: bifunctional nuclease family protein [candidate division WOR-3 bacterium]|uniref:Bifunctional nuclease family protein n=1 Tax=candidate division WOR-3 bacterium TaxID=2052148 RepID=A0A7C4S3D9_UNCW3